MLTELTTKAQTMGRLRINARARMTCAPPGAPAPADAYVSAADHCTASSLCGFGALRSRLILNGHCAAYFRPPNTYAYRRTGGGSGSYGNFGPRAEDLGRWRGPEIRAAPPHAGQGLGSVRATGWGRRALASCSGSMLGGWCSATRAGLGAWWREVLSCAGSWRACTAAMSSTPITRFADLAASRPSCPGIICTGPLLGPPQKP